MDVQMEIKNDCSFKEYILALTMIGLNVSGVVLLTGPGQGIIGSTLIAVSSILSLTYNAYKRKNHQILLSEEDIEKAH